MIYWRTIVRIIPDKVLKSKIFIVSSLVISVIPAIYDINYLAISRCVSFFPYFLIGWIVRDTSVLAKLDKTNKWKKAIVIFCAIISCLVATKIPLNIFWGHLPLDNSISIVFICKIISWCIAVIISSAIYLLIPRKFEFKDGKSTLGYYLFHTLLLFPVLDVIYPYLPKGYVATLVILSMMVILLHYTVRINFINKFLNFKPLTSLNHLSKFLNFSRG